MTDTDIPAIVHQLGREVAQHLGDGWTLQPPDPLDHRAILTGPEDMKLSFGPSSWNDARRIEITGHYPGRAGYLYGIKRHEISVSRARGAQVIAREITRRLLPAYGPDLSYARARIHGDAEAATARRRTGEAIAQALPGSTYSEPQSDHDRSGDSRVHLHIPDPAWGSVRLDHDGHSGALELHSVPRDMLLKLMTTLSTPTPEPSPDLDTAPQDPPEKASDQHKHLDN